MYTLLLADDCRPMRVVLRRLLEIDPRITLIGEAESFRRTLKIASKVKPYFLLMDVHMPDERQFDPAFIKRELIWSCATVFAMSAWKTLECEALARSYGATCLLDKAEVADAVFGFMDELEAAQRAASDRGLNAQPQSDGTGVSG